MRYIPVLAARFLGGGNRQLFQGSAFWLPTTWCQNPEDDVWCLSAVQVSLTFLLRHFFTQHVSAPSAGRLITQSVPGTVIVGKRVQVLSHVVWRNYRAACAGGRLPS